MLPGPTAPSGNQEGNGQLAQRTGVFCVITTIIICIWHFLCTDRPGVNPTLCAQREDRDTCDRSGPTSHRWQTSSVAPRLSDKHSSPLQKLFFQEPWFVDSSISPRQKTRNLLNFVKLSANFPHFQRLFYLYIFLPPGMFMSFFPP